MGQVLIEVGEAGSSELVKKGWYRQSGNSPSEYRASLTRRTISRAVVLCFVEAKAV